MSLRTGDAGSYTGVEGRPCMPPHCPAGDVPIKGKFPGDPKAEYPPGARASAVGIFYRDGYSHEAQGGIDIRGLRVVESRGARPWLQAMGLPPCGPKCKSGLANITVARTSVTLAGGAGGADAGRCAANLSQPQAAVSVERASCGTAHQPTVSHRISLASGLHSSQDASDIVAGRGARTRTRGRRP